MNRPTRAIPRRYQRLDRILRDAGPSSYRPTDGFFALLERFGQLDVTQEAIGYVDKAPRQGWAITVDGFVRWLQNARPSADPRRAAAARRHAGQAAAAEPAPLAPGYRMREDPTEGHYGWHAGDWLPLRCPAAQAEIARLGRPPDWTPSQQEAHARYLASQQGAGDA